MDFTTKDSPKALQLKIFYKVQLLAGVRNYVNSVLRSTLI